MLELAEVADGIAEAYRSGTAAFQQHIANRALVFTYLTGQAAAMLEWADAADAYLDAPAGEAPALNAIERARDVLSRARGSGARV